MISVGHVPPGQEVTVLGTWAIPLAAAGDGAILLIPTTVGDVYGRSPLADSDDLTHAPIRLEADLEVSCDSGVLSLERGRLVEGKARVTLNAPVVIRVAGAVPQVLRGVAADGCAVALTVEPAAPGDAALDGVLLLDNSGLMNEAAAAGLGSRVRIPSKHEVALRGLKSLAADLRPADRLDIWEFNSLPRHLGLGIGEAAVGKLVARLQPPTGGTETGQAIESVLAGREGADVLLVTDGQSHALDVHALARRGARFTVVLVGEDSLAANVGHLAALTGGQIFVSSGLDLAEMLQQAIASLRGGRLRQPKIEGKAAEATATLMGGMRVTARWEPASHTPLPAATAEAGRAIAAYAVWLALPLMAEEEAAALAEAEGVVCHLTSMVLVDTAGEVQQGIPTQRKVPLMSLALLADPHPLIPMDAACYPTARTAAMRTSARAAVGLAPVPGAPMVSAPSSSVPPRVGPARTGGMYRKHRSGNVAGSGDLSIPTLLPHPGQTKADRATRKRSESTPSPQASRGSIAPKQGDLKAYIGRVDWTSNLEALRQGVLRGNVPSDVLMQLEAAGILGAVQDLAAALGVTVEAVVVALLARAEELSSRNAARLVRAVLGTADQTMLETAERAVGL